uniref:Uncharacterized protein n=1 Tax=Salarias fasciatus TaxID=181472 RepID=A0A672J9F1_SALFA
MTKSKELVCETIRKVWIPLKLDLLLGFRTPIPLNLISYLWVGLRAAVLNERRTSCLIPAYGRRIRRRFYNVDVNPRSSAF